MSRDKYVTKKMLQCSPRLGKSIWVGKLHLYSPIQKNTKTIEYKTNGIKRDKNERLGNSNIYVISNKRSDLTLIQGAKLSFVCLALELSWPHASNSLMDNSGVSLICKMLLFLHPMFSSPTEIIFMLVGLK